MKNLKMIRSDFSEFMIVIFERKEAKFKKLWFEFEILYLSQRSAKY